MGKEILKYIGFLIVIFLLLVGGMFAYLQYKNAAYQKTAVPYLETIIPRLFQNDPALIKEEMSDIALEAVSDDKLSKVLAYYRTFCV